MKLGLALGSGGVKGLVHVGIIKKLVENNIKIDYIAGTSIGAWVGVFYSIYEDIEKLEEYTVNKKKEKFYTFLEPSLSGGLVRGNKLEKLLEDWFENKTFKSLNIPTKILATDLKSGEEVILEKGSLAKSVRASMCIPTLFKPVEYNGRFLVDGGLCNPVPDDVVKKMGADIVVSVNLDNCLKNKKFNTEHINLSSTLDRSFEIFQHHLAKYSIKNTDYLIEPQMPTVGYIKLKDYFTKDIGAEFVKIGEKEGEKLVRWLNKS